MLRIAAQVSNFEAPAVLIAIAAAIPGLADESLFALVGVALLGLVAILRFYVRFHRTEILERLEQAASDGNLSGEELAIGKKALNTLTVAGGAGE